MGRVSELIDTTEMYLRTIFELEEEDVRPMRARIAERLGQSGPTVSQTVARMQRDGLVELDQEDRHLMLTAQGAALAMRVMRKHRLAECLLVDLIGLPYFADWLVQGLPGSPVAHPGLAVAADEVVLRHAGA